MKKCVKCGSYMVCEEGTFTCEKCLKEILDIKRSLWESGSKIIEKKCDICGKETEELNVVLRDILIPSALRLCNECLSKNNFYPDAFVVEIGGKFERDEKNNSY